MDMHETALVSIPQRWARTVLVANIIVPGLGTIIAGVLVKGDPLINNVIVGLLQLVLTPFFLVGWIWSIILGIQLYKKSNDQIETPQPESELDQITKQK